MDLTIEFIRGYVKKCGLYREPIDSDPFGLGDKSFYSYIKTNSKKYGVVKLDYPKNIKHNGIIMKHIALTVGDNRLLVFENGDVEYIEYTFQEFIDDLDKAEQVAKKKGPEEHAKFCGPIDEIMYNTFF